MKIEMKVRLSFLFVLILSVISISTAHSQIKKHLTIGDTLPDLRFTLVNSSSQVSKEVADFKGKVILIDFWGTWCGPCVALMPKMDSLQNIFKDKLVVLPVTEETAQVVQSFLKKLSTVKKVDIFSVVGDNPSSPISLNALFPHQTVPHYVWIDASHTIRAITYMDQVTAKNLSDLVNGKELHLPFKDDLKNFAEQKDSTQFWLNKIWGDTSILEFHTFAKMTPSMPGSGGWGKNWIWMTNAAIPRLFQIAYGIRDLGSIGGGSTFRILTTDSTQFDDGSLWGQANYEHRAMWRVAPGHEFTYILKIPMSDSAKLYDKMKEDLAKQFPFISAKRETQKATCLVLVKDGGNSSFEAKDDDEQPIIRRNPYYIKCTNVPMHTFFGNLKLEYQGSGLQMFDETGYSGKVD
ncbi:MAG: TlpA family protein disulfide reductase, partial [Bacteroidetes bacterium]|nr:TlpA family protein disulfide reductase [Bacteroidota bacterium]